MRTRESAHSVCDLPQGSERGAAETSGGEKDGGEGGEEERGRGGEG